MENMRPVSTLADRLGRAMAYALVNPYRLAKDTQTDIGTITRTLAGGRLHHQHTTVAAWAKRCAVRMEWLSVGEGPMIEDATPRHLRERPEWNDVAAAARTMYPNLTEEDLQLVGEMYDHPAIWPGPLDAVAVATLAMMRRDWLARETARHEK